MCNAILFWHLLHIMYIDSVTTNPYKNKKKNFHFLYNSMFVAYHYRLYGVVLGF